MKPVSKDSIRSRLLKNAAHFWGQENTQHLDPFASLLMEALATELYKAYNEMQTTEARILEKITRLLTPELYVSPRPAHAIAHLRIREVGQVLDARNQFFTQQRIATKEEGILDAEYPVVFTPLGAVPLVDGDVRFIATGERIFSVAEACTKIFLASSQTGLPRQQVWIGLELNPAETPRDLTLYLRFSLEVEDFVYSLLPTAEWSVAGVPVAARSGMQLADAQSRSSEESVFSDYETMKLIERDIETHYARYFVTLEDVGALLASPEAAAIPDDVQAAFPAAAQAVGGRRTVWIGAMFPSYFTPELLDHLSVSVNAFPVVNRRLHVQYHPLREVTKIIPLSPQPYEQFLSVSSLADDRGRAYHALPFRVNNESGAGGFYSIKYGGAERFDERDAQEYLSNLAELLRDEVAAFAAYGKDFVKSTVADLSKKIRLIQQRARVDLARFLDIPTYLMLEPLDSQSANVEVQFWITNTTLANGIRAGTELLRLQTSLNIQSCSRRCARIAGLCGLARRQRRNRRLPWVSGDVRSAGHFVFADAAAPRERESYEVQAWAGGRGDAHRARHHDVRFSLLFNLFDPLKGGLWAATCAVPMVIPLLFHWSYGAFLEVPPEIFKVWQYAYDRPDLDLDGIDFNRMMVLEVEFSRRVLDEGLVKVKAKAPANVRYGDWFQKFINDYNFKFPENIIQPADEYQQSYSWIFYTKPSFFRGRRYLDPDLTVTENGVQETKTIVCKRVIQHAESAVAATHNNSTLL